MKDKYIAPSELLINPDGSVYHMHVKPGQLGEKIILVGDPGRVQMVAAHFDRKECDIQNREFHTITGTFQGKRVSVISTGIGIGNIDIVMNEVDALFNIDFQTRCIREQITQLQIVRIGTCGGLQPMALTGTFVCSDYSIGLDGLLNFYGSRADVSDTEMERAFVHYMGWEKGHVCPVPYVVKSDAELVQRISGNDMLHGITITSCGFFGPQGRRLRLSLADLSQNAKIQNFTYNGMMVLNYEMESSALAGLASLLGHQAVTCCLVIANRENKTANIDYKSRMSDLINLVLQRI